MNLKHGLTLSSEYFTWKAMKSRCYNPKYRAFSDYGGRGITICDRWRNSFEAFLEDVGHQPSTEHTIDRFPNNQGNYEPGNVRWATPRQQGRNRRTNVVLVFGEKRMTLIEWSEWLGIGKTTLIERLRSGWTVRRALTEPVRRQAA